MPAEDLSEANQRLPHEIDAQSQELRAGEALYRRLFEDLPIGLFRTTQDGQIIDANPALVKLLCYPDQAGILAANLADLYADPREQDRLLAILARADTVSGFETPMRRCDAQLIWTRISARVCYGPGGRIAYYECTLEDITDQRRVAEERGRLQAENEHKARLLEALVETAPLGLAVVAGPDCQIQMTNVSFRALMCRSATIPAGATLADLWPVPDDARRVQEHVQFVLQSDRPVEAPRLTLAGDECAPRTVIVSAKRLNWHDQMAALVSLHDITQQELLMDQVRRRAGELSAALEAIPDFVAIFDSQGRITRLNRAAEQTLRAQGLGRPSDLRALYSDVQLVKANREPYGLDETPETRALRGENVQSQIMLVRWPRSPAWYAVSSAPIQGPDGEISGAVSTLTDITALHAVQQQLEEQTHTLQARDKEWAELSQRLEERVAQRTLYLTAANRQLQQEIAQRWQADYELRRREDRFRSSVASMLDGFAILTAVRDDQGAIVDFRYEYVNNVGCQMHGRTLDELAGRTVSDFWDFTSLAGALAIGTRVVETGRPVSREFLVPQDVPSAGSSPVMALDVQIVKLSDGVAATWRDITERKQAEEALRQAMAAAERGQQSAEALRRSAERRRQTAESLGEILDALNSNQPLDEILQGIAGQARQLFCSDAVAIYLQESLDAGPALVAAEHLPLNAIVLEAAPEIQAVLDRVLATRQPVALPEPAPQLAEGTEVMPPQSGVDPFASVLAVPILAHDAAYGAVFYYYREALEFSEDEMELAVVFGGQIALAIENARLKDRLEQAAALAERSRLARDLHDAVTQTLFSASIIAQALPYMWDSDPAEVRRGLDELRVLTRGALGEMRTLLLELRPAALAEKPLNELLQHLTEGFTGRTGVPIELLVSGNDRGLRPAVKIAFYRIAQEALNNVSKHARAQHLTIELHAQPSKVTLRVVDDGVGFDPRRTMRNQLGLGIMRERAESAGLKLQIKSQRGRGTTVQVEWHEDQPA